MDGYIVQKTRASLKAQVSSKKHLSRKFIRGANVRKVTILVIGQQRRNFGPDLGG
jgi:hypothetical protein